MLTKRQCQLLRFVSEYVTATGVCPSFDEIKDALDLKSKSGIHRLVSELEERGFIRRLPHRARAIEILRLPDDMETQIQLRNKSLSYGAGAAALQLLYTINVHQNEVPNNVLRVARTLTEAIQREQDGEVAA